MEETETAEQKTPPKKKEKETPVEVVAQPMIYIGPSIRSSDLSTYMALSQAYQARVAAAAAKLKYDEILELSGTDFTAVCIKVQNFLMV